MEEHRSIWLETRQNFAKIGIDAYDFLILLSLRPRPCNFPFGPGAMPALTHAPDQALLIIAHGERGGRCDNARLLELTDEVRHNLGNVEVEAAVLRGEPTIAESWARLSAPNRYVYPFFMADGFFCNRILPKKIFGAIGSDPREAGSPVDLLKPFGVSPWLAEAVTGSLVRDMASLGLSGSKPHLLIAAHGASVDRQSSKRAGELASKLKETGYFRAVSCAFLDEAPHLNCVIGTMLPNTMVLPLFNGLGSHSIDDMADLASVAPPETHFLDPVGGQDWVGDVITADVTAALQLSGLALAAE